MLLSARNFGLAGRIDVNLPGESRINAFGMFTVPRVLEIAMNGGLDPRSGKQLGPRTGEFESFETFDAFFNAFKEQLAYFMRLTAEEHNILLQAQTELFPDAVPSVLMEDALKVGRDALDRRLPFENGSVLNPVGMINVADSLAAIKNLVFEEKKVTARKLISALAINQAPYQATLLNMKFHPTALKSTEDLKKLSHLIKAYFNGGGKHIQFNVVDRQTLINAQQHPELYRDLLVRVAGYSAYFVHLTKAVQDEIILRTLNQQTNSAKSDQIGK